MLEEKLDLAVMKKLRLKSLHEPQLEAWKNFLQDYFHPRKEVAIALIGKYVELPDAYKSIVESFIHAGVKNHCKVALTYIHSESIRADNVAEKLGMFKGILVAPGFGQRGIEGKIEAIRYAREHNIPFLGICLGMQMAVIEFARNVLHWEGADSTEMDESTPFPVIDLMENQKKQTNKGGTMRLGAYLCHLKESSLAEKAYEKTQISERHRHRYEFNNVYLPSFEAAGMKATGLNPCSDLVEIVELPSHKWFMGVQFHPEYSSTVLRPHPLFVDFIRAAVQD